MCSEWLEKSSLQQEPVASSLGAGLNSVETETKNERLIFWLQSLSGRLEVIFGCVKKNFRDRPQSQAFLKWWAVFGKISCAVSSSPCEKSGPLAGMEGVNSVLHFLHIRGMSKSQQDISARLFSFQQERLGHVIIWDVSVFLLLNSNCFQWNRSQWKINKTFVTYFSCTEISHMWKLRYQPASSERPGKPLAWGHTMLEHVFISQTSKLASFRVKVFFLPYRENEFLNEICGVNKV